MSVISERQDDVFAPLEALMRTDIKRSGLECFAGFHNPAAILPDLAWCLLVLDFRKPQQKLNARTAFGELDRSVRCGDIGRILL